MRTKRSFIFKSVVLLTFVFTVSSFSQETKDVKTYLLSDLVMVKDDKFMMDEYRVCQIVRPEAMGEGLLCQ